MPNEIKVNYRGQVVLYDEGRNCWNCELFSRPAESLESAKKRIDDKLDKEKKSPFARFDAYYRGYPFTDRISEGRYAVVTVTGTTDDGDAWVVAGKDKRKVRAQEFVDTLYPVNPENDALIKEYNRLLSERNSITKKMDIVTNKLSFWAPPKKQ